MSPEENFLIVGLLMIGIPVLCCFPWWLNEVRKIGSEQKKEKDCK